MHTSNYTYHHGNQKLQGFVAYNNSSSLPRPAVLVVHDWSGRNEFACDKATSLAEMGYVGFAVDMYGEGRTGETNEEKQALMSPLINDRNLLRDRVYAAFDALATLPEVDPNRIAIIGFCFGGLCALDLARSGAKIRGAVSFHGSLTKPEHLVTQTIQAKILVLHGYDDPMIRPEQVHVFCKEMNEANADWQVHMYGHVQHAFTNPNAHDEKLGLIFNALANQRSWKAMTNFLSEVFKD